MSTSRRLLPLLPYLVATATVTLGVVLALPDATIDPDVELDTSHVVDLSVVRDRYELAADDAADPVADCLIELGYRGLPGDGVSVIYAPAAAIEGCAAQVEGDPAAEGVSAVLFAAGYVWAV